MPAATHKLKAEQGLSRASSVSKTETPSEGTESNYLKELQKSLRNTTKKLNSCAKVDAILAENPDKSLDQLIEEKKINNDQKAQHLRKAALQATAAHTEEQINHYKQFAAQYEERLVAQQAELTQSFEKELEAVRANAIADATEAAKKAERRKLHTLAKFLCSAAILRRDGEVNAESQAFESVLFQVYGGSLESVGNMQKIIDGVDEKIPAGEGSVHEFTYADVKQACDRIVPAEEDSETSTETIPSSDPTLANAGLTELQDGTFANDAPATSQADQLAPPAQAIVSDGANDVAEKSAGSSGSGDSDWVELPRNPAETETGLQATPASADAGLTNGSVGADAASQAVPEATKKSTGRRRNNNRSTRDGQPQRENQGKREGKAQREGPASEQAPREGQAQGQGRGREGRPRGEGRGRGGRGRGRGAPAGNGAEAASAPKSTE